MARWMLLGFLALALVLAAWWIVDSKSQPKEEFSAAPTAPSSTLRIAEWNHVEDFSQELAQFETVFWDPADTVSLRQLIRESSLVKGKSVYEIGTGTGLVSLCCLQAGARRVVATDINPAAVANARYNAGLLGLSDRLEVRQVSQQKPGAFDVLHDDERFDLIISNPPWEDDEPDSIDEHAFYDPGFALLRSLLEGANERLTADGKILLAYGCVDAINTLYELAPQHGFQVKQRDSRKLDELPPVFLPGMLLEVTP